MKNVKIHRRVSIFDVTPPWSVSEKRYNLYLQKLKPIFGIDDTTVCGEFVYSRNTARNLRVEVDSRFVSDEQLLRTLTTIFAEVEKETRRYQEYA